MSNTKKGKKVIVNGKNPIPIEAYLIEDCELKFIVTNESGNIEMHYPKKDYSYIILEEKWK